MSHLSVVAAARAGRVAADDSADDGFKALAEPSRRLRLDSLFVHDGQTLGELSARLPAMTRFGVMKHLRQLEAANLVLTRKVGREKLHYLNPVPIRLIHDPAFTQRFFFQTKINAEWRPGAPVQYWMRDGQLAVEGEVLESDPPRRLVTTWAFRHQPELASDPPSRVTWEIEPLGEMCRLTLVHDNFTSETATYRSVGGGWPLVLSSLKSLLETGEPLPSLRR